MEDCVFCKIIKKEIPAEIIRENENFIVIKDIHPKTQGHSLVIPKQHFETFLNFPLKLSEEFLTVSKEIVNKLLKETNSEGFNLIMNNFKSAGQIVPHMHFHILPRKEGDDFRVNV